MLGADSGRAVAAVRTLLVFLSIVAVLLTGMATVLADPAHAADEGPATFEEATADRSPFGDTSSETDSDAADPRTDVGSQSGGGEVQDEPHGSGGTQSDSSADQPLADEGSSDGHDENGSVEDLGLEAERGAEPVDPAVAVFTQSGEGSHLAAPNDSGINPGSNLGVLTTTSSVSPVPNTDSGEERTFTVTYKNTSARPILGSGTVVSRARIWHQIKVDADHYTTYTVDCDGGSDALFGTDATCPEGLGIPSPSEEVTINGEAGVPYNTFWAVVPELRGQQTLTFTIKVTTTLKPATIVEGSQVCTTGLAPVDATAYSAETFESPAQSVESSGNIRASAFCPPDNSAEVGSGPTPAVQVSWEPDDALVTSGTQRTFSIRYINNGNEPITNARVWHEYMVAADALTTYSVSCTSSAGAALCPTSGAPGFPSGDQAIMTPAQITNPVSGWLENYYHKTFWAVVDIPVGATLTFTVKVTSNLVVPETGCYPAEHYMVGGWARFNRTAFTVSDDVQASASQVGSIEKPAGNLCDPGVVKMTNEVFSPVTGNPPSPEEVLSGEQRTYRATWTNTSNSSAVTTDLSYAYYVPYADNLIEASWTCEGDCPSGFASGSLDEPIVTDGTEAANVIVAANAVTLGPNPSITLTVTLTTTLQNCTQDGFYRVQTYARRNLVAGDPPSAPTSVSTPLAVVGCVSWMGENDFDPENVDPNWRALGAACLTGLEPKSSAQGGMTYDPPVWDPMEPLAPLDEPMDVEPLRTAHCNDQNLNGVPSRGKFYGSDVGNFIQLTDDQGGQVGAALYNRAFPSKNGLVVEFTQYQYKVDNGDTPADGLSFFLADGAWELDSIGADGGGLGYANRHQWWHADQQAQFGPPSYGLPRGYMGVGFDVWGNYGAESINVATQCDPGRTENGEIKNAVTIRGPGNLMEGYCPIAVQTPGAVNEATVELGETDRLATVVTGNDLAAAARKTRVTISPLKETEVNPAVTVEIDFGDGSGYKTIIENAYMPDSVPDLVKFGFAASTGGASDAHLVGGLKVGTVIPLEDLDVTKTLDRDEGVVGGCYGLGGADLENCTASKSKTSYDMGDIVPYIFTVQNTTTTGSIYDVRLTDPALAQQGNSVSCLAGEEGQQVDVNGKLEIEQQRSATCTGYYFCTMCLA